MVVPSIPIPNINTCSVVILQANCSSWSQVISQLLVIPDNCEKPWKRIILNMTSSEQGTQYDRFGAVWIGDIEVIRTTTPEPTSDGIQWVITKDISDYRQYLEIHSDLYTFISIPNNVDSTYTGVINVEITLTFYFTDVRDFQISQSEVPPKIIPLTCSSQRKLIL
jgi:hypothetical protein